MAELSERTIWRAMKNRCHNPNDTKYHSYGGRGIKVCDRWINDFEMFFQDMGARPSSDHSIDRMDNEKGYSPENCRWATWKEQQNNRRDNNVIVINNISKTLSQWCDEYNAPYKTVWYRIMVSDMAPLDALTRVHKRDYPLCAKGHNLSGENLQIRKSNGQRICRQCNKDRIKKFNQRRLLNV